VNAATASIDDKGRTCRPGIMSGPSGKKSTAAGKSATACRRLELMIISALKVTQQTLYRSSIIVLF
jgi:hypothetical protein